MTHASLFSGIGGFDLAAEQMGWQNLFHCEWNSFCQKVLKYHFPTSILYEDITQTDFTIPRGQVDVLTGGFPCQPFSLAGKRGGTQDDRYLWPHMLRAIDELQPTWVIGENVTGITSMVLDQRLVEVESQIYIGGKNHVRRVAGKPVLLQICEDLEQRGYEVQTLVIPACALGAPHRRDRVWIIAHANSSAKKSSGTGERIDSQRGENLNEQKEWGEQTQQHIGCGDILRDAANSQRIGQPGQGRTREQGSARQNKEWKASWAYHDGRWPTQSPICSRDDGLSTRLDGITFSKWREESIKACGNAIVPQVAFEIFKGISLTARN